MNGSIGALVAAAQQGDALAAKALLDALYDELHRMARRDLARRGGPAEISPTTLLHQAYIDMAGNDRAFPDRARFMGYAARVMRGLLIDHVRALRAHKRGGQFHITALPTDVAEQVADVQELTGISDALDELAPIDQEAAELVGLKFLRPSFFKGHILPTGSLSSFSVRFRSPEQTIFGGLNRRPGGMQ